MAKNLSSDRLAVPAGGRFLALWLLLAAIAVVGLLLILRPRPEVVPVEVGAPFVSVVQPDWREGPLVVVGQGIVMPRARVSLAAQVRGEVLEVSPALVAGGQFNAGDVLLKLDARSFKAAVQQSAGDLKAARADLEFSAAQVQRLEKLVADSLIQQEKLDEERARQSRLLGQVSALEAARLRNSIDLEHTRIIAPFAGKVFGESVDIGDVVEPGRELAQIFPLNDYEVTVALDDKQASLIPGLWQSEAATQGVAARVRVEYGGVDYEWQGFVHRAEAALDQQSRTVNVVVRIPDPNKPGVVVNEADSGVESLPLLPGMYATAHIDGVNPGRAAAIPRAALREGEYIWAVNAEQKLRIIQVRVLQITEDTAVLAGEEMAQVKQLVSSPLTGVTDGMAVQLRESRAAETVPSDP